MKNKNRPKKTENIYIQWHFSAHGIAYFKHILAAFYDGRCSIKQKTITATDLLQEELNEVFEPNKRNKNGFIFDKIYYFYVDQSVVDNAVTFNLDKKKNLYLFDELLKEKDPESLKIWKTVITKNFNLKEEYQYIKSHYPQKYKKIWKWIWRNIQYYPVNEQIWWFKMHSNAKDIYNDRIEFINMTKNEKVKDIHNYEQIAIALRNQINKIKQKHQNANFIVNPILASREIQIVWHSLANFGILPTNTRFITSYDNKDKYPKHRFKLFNIKEIPSNIISYLHGKINLYNSPSTEARKLADKLMKLYMQEGFAILLLGERGIGKTHLAEKYKGNKNFVSVNCASFTDNSLAESILFGYKKGAFTGANEDRKGVFEEADGGILFFDEIHHLDKLMQAKLIKAIQTDQDNKFTIRRLGDNKERKVSATLIFASNRSIEELKQVLLPDFYDRITQLVIELPPLRETPQEIFNDFKMIWQQMKFEAIYPFDQYVANDRSFYDWLKTLKLPGNYRDLQRIAIYYKVFLDFDNSLKKMMNYKTPFEFTKSQYQKYTAFNEKTENILFDINKNPKELIKLYQKMLAEKFIENYGSAKKVSEKFNITERTLYQWKNLR